MRNISAFIFIHCTVMSQKSDAVLINNYFLFQILFWKGTLPYLYLKLWEKRAVAFFAVWGYEKIFF